MRATLKIFVASLLVTLAVAWPAAAQNPTQNGYNLRAGVTESSINHPASHADNGGSLPFTGLQVGIVLAAGFVLVGAGLGVRRLSRPTQS